MPISTNDNKHQDAFFRACTLESLFKYKWVALAAFLSVLLFTIAFLFSRERNFQSEAKLFVRVGRETVTVDPTALATGQLMMMNQSQQRQIQSAVDLLNSRAILELVVDKVGAKEILDQLPDEEEKSGFIKNLGKSLSSFRKGLVDLNLADPKFEREEAISLLSTTVASEAEPDSNVVSINARSYDPKLAQEIGQAFIENFQHLHMSAHRSPGSFEFFEEQSAQAKNRLDDAVLKLRDAKNEGNIASVEGQRQILEGRLLALEHALQAATATSSGSVAKAKAMEKSLQEIPERIVTEEVEGLANTAKSQMRAELFKKQLMKNSLAGVYTKDHPMRNQIEQEMSNAERLYGVESETSQQKTGVNEAHQNFKLSLLLEQSTSVAENARVEVINDQIASLQTEIRELNRNEAIVNDLQRNVDVLDAKYRTYVESLEKTRIEQALERDRLSSINVIQSPALNKDPSDFGNSILALAGLILACAVAPFTAVTLAFLNNNLSTAEDVERELQIPVFLTIPNKRSQRIAI